MRYLSAAAICLASMIVLTQMALAEPVSAQLGDWTGWYAGLNVGMGWAGDRVHTTGSNSHFCPPGSCGHAQDAAQASIQGVTGAFNVSNQALLGGQLGYNWPLADRWIIGVQADLQFPAGNNSHHTHNSVDAVSGFAGHSVATAMTVTKKIDYLGTLSGRLGYLVTPTIAVVGTAGLGYGHIKSTTNINQNFIGYFGGVADHWTSSSSASKMLGGWTAGGSVEWQFAPKWVMSFGYLYYNLGKVTHNGQLIVPTTVGSPPDPYYFINDVETTTRYNGNIVRLALNYQF